MDDFVRKNLPIFLQVENLSIRIPALPRPTLQELQGTFLIKSIERDTSPTEEVTLKLATVLRSNEERISGREYERRIAPKLNIILGYQQAVWLVEHQDEFSEFMALVGKFHIDFPSLIVVETDNRQRIPYLTQFSGRWFLGWDRFSAGFHWPMRLAFSGK